MRNKKRKEANFRTKAFMGTLLVHGLIFGIIAFSMGGFSQSQISTHAKLPSTKKVVKKTATKKVTSKEDQRISYKIKKAKEALKKRN